MKLLFVSHLYPSSTEPGLAPFNRQLVAALARMAEVRVVAPVFWFPVGGRLRGRRLPPRQENRAGLPVEHPRVPYTPGMWIHQHWRMYRRAVRETLDRVLREFRPDHVMVGFAYPDGAAVGAIIAEGMAHGAESMAQTRRPEERTSIPFGSGLCPMPHAPCALQFAWSVRVNGSDFRVRVRQPKFRGIVLSTLRQAPLIFCPGQALKRDMAAEGIDDGKIVAFNNGVDGRLFRWRPKDEAEQQLATADGHGWTRIESRKIVLFVGNLVHVKGPDRLVEAWRKAQSAWRMAQGGAGSETPCAMRYALCILGEGPMRRSMAHSAWRMGIGNTVVFLGNRPHEEVALWMNAADCLCVPSRSEGMPNVVLEALASGLPVVATDAGEIPALVRDGENGFVVRTTGRTEEEVVDDLAAGIRNALDRSWDRSAVAQGVEGFTWDRAAETILGRIGSRDDVASRL